VNTPGGYSRSHLAAEKPAGYEALYATDAWHKRLWSSEQRVLDRILTENYRGKPVKLLDFACGTGRITSFLEDKVHEATGVDVSEPMLAVARDKLKRTRLLRADLTQNNPFGQETFNLITAFRFFVNAEPKLRTAAIKVLSSLLSEDGLLVFNNHQNLLSLSMLCGRLADKARRRTPRNMMTLSLCRALAAEAGLNVVRVYSVGFLHLPKFCLPALACRLLDDWAGRSNFLGSFSECPVMVCRAKGR